MIENTDPTSEYIKKNSEMIERTFDAFGIKTRVAEVTNDKDSICFSLEIAMGTKLDDVVALNKDIAIALAAPEGKVEIIAPEPGRALVGIIVKKRKESLLSEKKGKYKLIYIDREEHVKNSLIQQIRNDLAIVMSSIAMLAWKFAQKIRTEDNLDSRPYAKDELFKEAVELVRQDRKASASIIQQRLSIGYARAARIIDQMEYEGIIGKAQGSKPREVLI
ncbi:hypothetical protein A2957_00100 [Candidatus Roizmanbacteria bacterium RIFCSPLOWO2_01_FULL_38_11]|uniref:FtsK gamma domain-containing protein n=1 Tax=Candidatus Roizmanbacteria bacterium RIFCSPLOWO2_01_FULL_38_11 TaxID=1802060 RepID=A0A1F7IMW6_9BACT|nr:MAG: hypothetical protein A2957_00100 [Candidatus Roizmanbacteria bacterium RIFCSPLOWO2_01_FULL_38_11]